MIMMMILMMIMLIMINMMIMLMIMMLMMMMTMIMISYDNDDNDLLFLFFTAYIYVVKSKCNWHVNACGEAEATSEAIAHQFRPASRLLAKSSTATTVLIPLVVNCRSHHLNRSGN